MTRNPTRPVTPRWGATTMTGRELVVYASTPAQARERLSAAGVVTLVGAIRPLAGDDRVVITDKRITS